MDKIEKAMIEQKMNNCKFNVSIESIKSGKIVKTMVMNPKKLINYLMKTIWDFECVKDAICFELFQTGMCQFANDNNDIITITFA